MDLLFIHGNGGFSLAEWCLRDALATECSVATEFHTLEMTADSFERQEEARQLVAALQPAVVGFSCHAWTMSCFVEAASWFKHVSPATRVVLGGPQVSSTPAATEVLRRWPHVDFVIRGPGEQGIAALAEALSGRRSFAAVPGLSRRDDGRASHNPAVPLGDWARDHLIFHADNERLAHRLEGLFQASYETVRGCRNSCLYCVYPGDGMACLDESIVHRELEFLCAFRIPHLRICDAHFGGSRLRAKSILRHLVKVNRSTSVKIYPALEHVDAEYVSLAADAGAEITSIGIQTTNDAALKAIRRPPTHGHREAISMLLDRFPQTPADLIVGLPGDDMEGLEQSIRDVIDLGFARLNLFRLTAFPGTTLSENVALHLGGTDLRHASTGQMLSSVSFPAESQRDVAALIGAALVAVPLRSTRRALEQSEIADLYDRLAHGIRPESLVLLKRLMTEAGASEVLKRLPTILAHFDPIIGDRPGIRDALVADVLDVLHRRYRDARQRQLLWIRRHSVDAVRTVVVTLNGGNHLVWDIAAGTLARHGQLPGSLDLHSFDCLHLTRLFEREAVESSTEVR